MNLRSRIFGFILLSLMAGSCPDAGAKPLLPPPEVIKAAQKLYLGDTKPKPHQVNIWRRQGVLRPVRLSHSHAYDWFIDVGRGPGPGLCGTGGCPLQIWVKSTTGPYTKAFDVRVRDYSLKQPAGKAAYLLIDVHGANCGLAGYAACPVAFQWREQDGFTAVLFAPGQALCASHKLGDCAINHLNFKALDGAFQ